MIKLVFGRLGLLVLGVAVVVLLAELGFRVAGALAPFGVAVPDAGGKLVVLCVGDSHIWGGGEGVPRRLAVRLAERSPDARVINLGIPGTNSAQLRSRFVGYLERYGPRIVVVWTGINNHWNEAGRAREKEPSLLSRALIESRALRFLRVWRHQRELELQLSEATVYQSAQFERRRQGDPVRLHRAKLWGERLFAINLEGSEPLEADEVVRVTEADLAAVVEAGRERGVAVVLLSYPQPFGWFGNANRGIERAAAATGALGVSGQEAASRFAARYRQGEAPPAYDATIHPTEALYREIGDLLFERLDAAGLLPPGRAQ